MNELSEKETLRYSRHLLLEEVGLEGQLALKSSTVAVVGAGGLGSPALLYLAAAGIGTLILIDDDEVELSNLQRQIIHDQQSVGESKVDSAAKRISVINSDVDVVAVGTGQALRNAQNGDADLLIVHATEREKQFVAKGFGVQRFDLMYNDFILVGGTEGLLILAGVDLVVGPVLTLIMSELLALN